MVLNLYMFTIDILTNSWFDGGKKKKKLQYDLWSDMFSEKKSDTMKQEKM